MSEDRVIKVGKFTATVKDWSPGFKKVVNLRADKIGSAIIFELDDVGDLAEVVKKIQEETA